MITRSELAINSSSKDCSIDVDKSIELDFNMTNDELDGDSFEINYYRLHGDCFDIYEKYLGIL
jgi:hypothetical protein